MAAIELELEYHPVLSHASNTEKEGRATMERSKRARRESPTDELVTSELRLLNEQLTEEVRLLKEQEARDKKKFVRQLNFLESENEELRASISSKTEQYFSDKRKWQATLQEVEKEAEIKVKAAQKEVASSASSSSSSSSLPPRSTTPSTGMIHQHQDAYWAEKIASIEDQVKARADEAVQALAAKNMAEATCQELQRKVTALEARLLIAGAQGAGSDFAGERELEMRCNDLENKLQKMTRENGRLSKKLQNQELLEDRVEQMSTRLKIKKNAGGEANMLEASYEKLMSEKKDWTLLFASVVGGGDGGQSKPLAMKASASPSFSSASSPSSSSSPVSSSGASEITPHTVYRALSAAQKQSAVLLKKVSDQEIQLTSAHNTIKRTQASLEDALSDKESAVMAKDSAEISVRRQKQQARLFEGEVASLRALAKSYNNELSMGSKATEMTKVVKIKDDTIDALQKELDKARASHAGLVKEMENMEALGKSQPAPPSSSSLMGSPHAAKTSSPQVSARHLDAQREEALELRSQIQGLRDELLGLQKATGIDFVPGRVRVLHLRQNPAAAAGVASKGTSETFVNSLEELRRLRDENHRLRDMAIQPDGDLDENTLLPTPGQTNLTPAASILTPATSTPNVIAPDSSKLNQRLKEMFRERITCFREAVYLLTGYKIDLFSPDGTANSYPRLKLRSMYAEDPEDAILFQWRGDSLELMETPFAKNIDPRLLSILRGTNSVPAFLANTTLDLFERQTFLG